MHVGHALLGERGEMLSLDEGFCAILRTDADAMIGRGILDVTVPADRMTCRDLMRNLQATHEPFQVTKRFLRGDGSTVWVSNTVSIVDLGTSPAMIVSTIVPIDPPHDRDAPVAMLDAARFMLAVRGDRAAAFDTEIFAAPAWDIVIAAYIVEAEGGVLDLAALALHADASPEMACRWARALEQEGLLERELGPDGHAAYRLTTGAHAKCETFLSGTLARSVARA